ncbi:hypothetical protein [Thioclava sp. NG1]|uniref:hypothetical protein n=1 Tax=Thioclava sp. NG1 TaxID=2182426 RepID=UPI001304F2E1|nr:hypothetical protein [Thioclava sp. NG1]
MTHQPTRIIDANGRDITARLAADVWGFPVGGHIELSPEAAQRLERDAKEEVK